MSEIWLPAAQLILKPIGKFDPGTIVISARQYAAKPTNVGIICRQPPGQNEQPLNLIYTLTSWFEGRISFGSILQIENNTELFGLKTKNRQFHQIEFDLSASTVEGRNGGQIGWGDKGLRLLGNYDENGFRSHIMEVDPETWEVVYPKLPNREVHTYIDRWRLRLHFSEREIVTLVEAGRN